MRNFFQRANTPAPVGTQDNPLPADFVGGISNALFDFKQRQYAKKENMVDNTLLGLNPKTGLWEQIYEAFQLSPQVDESHPSQFDIKTFFASDPTRPAGATKVSTTKENSGLFFWNKVVPASVAALTAFVGGGLVAGAAGSTATATTTTGSGTATGTAIGSGTASSGAVISESGATGASSGLGLGSLATTALSAAKSLLLSPKKSTGTPNYILAPQSGTAQHSPQQFSNDSQESSGSYLQIIGFVAFFVLLFFLISRR